MILTMTSVPALNHVGCGTNCTTSDSPPRSPQSGGDLTEQWPSSWPLDNFSIMEDVANGSDPSDLIPTVSSPIIPTSSASGFGSEVMIPLYSVIFFLSMVGNTLVIVTLAQNRRMRTVTNVFLLNLAVADLLVGVFCMPVTLIGQMMRDFVFGPFMCKIIPYFQAVSVSVGVWTLVAISLERYFAICRPLKSRIWQTRSHAYKMIVAVWIISLACCLPIAVFSRLIPIRDTGRHKCREEWPGLGSERAYSLLLVVSLLLLPLMVMAMAYWLIAARLWRGLRQETSNTRYPPLQAPQTPHLVSHCPSSCSVVNGTDIADETNEVSEANGSNGIGNRTVVIQMWSTRSNHRRLCCEPLRPASHFQQRRNAPSSPWRSYGVPSRNAVSTTPVQIMDYQTAVRNGVRSTYTDKSVLAKKKVIRMLFVIVLEFFVCWAPLYVVNTWYVYDPNGLYAHVGSTEVALVQLLAYMSSCCNPITYCFMNEKFRNGFLNAFGCRRRHRRHGPARSTDLMSASFNDSINLGRRSFRGNPRMTKTIVETSFTVFDASTSNVRSPD